MNSKDKGNRFEREVVKLLEASLGMKFARNPTSYGSGAFATTHDLAGLDMNSIAGDIITPYGFRFSIECKSGYDLNITHLMADIRGPLIKFIEQAVRDSSRVKKQPMIIWKPDRSPILAIFPAALTPKDIFCFRLYTQGWVIVGLEDFLDDAPKEFWMDRIAQLAESHSADNPYAGDADGWPKC